MGAKSQTRIFGTVHDESGNPIPYTTIRLKDTSNGCTTDNNGNFSFYGDTNGQILQISAIGYDDYVLTLGSNTKFPISAILTTANYSLSEVEIKPGRERYNRKDNPALELAQHLIRKRKADDPHNNDYVSRNRYENLLLALDDFNEEKQQQPAFRKFDFLKDFVDTSRVSGRPILNISSRELVATDYYRKKPEKEKQHITGRNWVGIDDFLPAEQIEASIESALVDIDLFGEKIFILRNEFVSPLSEIATTYYKYYILDTLMVEGEKCVDLSFVPNNSKSYGFTGHLYVTADSTHFIKWVQMSVPHDINMNFVEYMNLEQRFSRDAEHNRLLTYESINTEFKLYDFIDGIYARREVFYSDYRFNEDVRKEIFDRPENVFEEVFSRDQDEEFWAEHRDPSMSDQQKSMNSMLAQLRQQPLYFWTQRMISLLFTGYIPIKEENTPYYYGPMNTSVSFNDLEGVRLRTGGMTTAFLNPHLFWSWYLVYGTKDERFKYMGRLEYSFKPKKDNWNEFPVHSLRLQYENDIFQYGQTYLYTNKDNIFLSLRRLPDNKTGYVKKAEFTYTNEFHNGFSYSAVLRNRINEASRFIPLERTLPDMTTVTDKQIMQSEFQLNLRYAPKEKFIQDKWNRYSVLPEHPVFTLSHTVAKEGVLGSQYTINQTEASYRQRLWASPFGYFDVILKGGKIWGQTPYPLMFIPNSNLSYTLREESFELMTPMEFVLDSHATWDICYFLNGALFNRLPLINRLNLREVITFRGILGTTMDQNDPTKDSSGKIYNLPADAIATHMNGTPYSEIGFGIENIFKFGRIDYFRRLTYKDTPGVATQGVRISIHAQF